MYDSIFDIKLNYDGDLDIDGGDLLLTSGMDWFQREINKRMRSGADWYHHPNLGANLGAYLGEANTRETGRRIKAKVLQSVTTGALHYPADIEVEVVPTGRNEIEVIVVLIADGERTVVSQEILRFDLGSVTPIADPTPSNPTPASTKSHYKTNTNEHLARMARR